ncbi:hypothetical protein BH11BAC1_BH11BAC1_22660 [soil metagenome]
MKNIKLNLLVLLMLLTTIYFFVYFSFYIHQWLSLSLQFLYPLGIAFLFILFVYLTLRACSSFKLLGILRSLFGLIFIVTNCILLFKLSSINREKEIQAYLEKNKNTLLNIVEYRKSHEDEINLVHMCEKAHIRHLSVNKGIYRFRLYTFLGYGYVLAYAETNELLTLENCFEGSPIVKWYLLDQHWAYFSFFD